MPIDSILIDSELKFLVESVADEQLLNQAKSAIEFAKRLVEEFDHAKAKVMTSNAYSPEGRASLLGELAEQHAARLRQLQGGCLSKLEERAVELEGRMAPVPVISGEVFALSQEYRALLRSMDPLEVESIYLEACRVGDALTAQAVETTPRWAPLLTPQVIAAGRRLRAEGEHPDMAATLRSLNATIAALRSVFNQAGRAMGIHEVDLVIKAAQGDL
jgi:hypothetical protein